jgi:phosphoketolase
MKKKPPKSSEPAEIVFLFDVDNTLLDNDRVIADLGAYLKRVTSPPRATKTMEMLIEHQQYIKKHGRDLPEIRNWKKSTPNK